MNTAWAGNEKTSRCNFSFFVGRRNTSEQGFLTGVSSLMRGDIRTMTECENQGNENPLMRIKLHNANRYNLGQWPDDSSDNGEPTHGPEVAVAHAQTWRHASMNFDYDVTDTCWYTASGRGELDVFVGSVVDTFSRLINTTMHACTWLHGFWHTSRIESRAGWLELSPCLLPWRR